LKKIEDLKWAVNRWTNSQLNFRASFYTGCSPSYSYLNSMILEKMYRGIKNDVSEEAATNFARFVARLKDLSPSAFIQAFERFLAHDCKDIEVSQKVGSSNYLTGLEQD
jgi:hypothetical protein